MGKHCDKSRVKCCVTIPIVPSQFVSGDSVTIVRPGNYCLAREVIFSPIVNGIAAIVVASDDVTINLRGLRLTHNPDSAATASIGIQVQAGHRNIVIENGAIDGFGAWGVQVLAGARDIVLRDLQIENNGGNPANPAVTSGGIQIAGTSQQRCSNVTIEDCISENNRTSINTVANGLEAISVDELVVTGGRFNNNFAIDRGVGASLIDVRDASVEHSAFDGNGASGTGIQQGGRGFVLQSGENVKIDKCTFNHNTGNNTCVGCDIILLGTPHILNVSVTNCIASGNAVLAANASRPCLGYRVQAGMVDPSNPTLFGARNVTLKNCIAEENTTAATVDGPQTVGAGFAIVNVVDGVVLEECIARNNRADLAATAIGFSIVALGPLSPTGIILRKCIATSQRGFTYSAGFDNNSGNPVTGIIFEDCISENNRLAPTSPLTSTSVGFSLRSMPQAALFNSIARGQQIGIRVATTSPNALIVRNTVYSNTVVGIVDDAGVASRSVYKYNEGYNNAVNFQGLPTGTPIQAWPVGSGGPGTPTPGGTDAVVLTNQNIVPAP